MVRFKQYFVYIMSSYSRVLYVGVTGDLAGRVATHRAAIDPKSFTARYNVHDLVYVEEYQTAAQAIARETQMKAYSRAKKVALIDAFNPGWKDLAARDVIPSRADGEESGRR